MLAAVLSLSLLTLIAPPADAAPNRPGSPNSGVAVGPSGNLTGLVTHEDYPADALKKLEQGTVTVLLAVNERGEVSGCAVQASSGSATLDAQTCRLLSERARLEPAKDATGRPVAGTFRQRISWILRPPAGLEHGPQGNLTGIVSLEDYPASAIANEEQGTVAVRIAVDERGRAADCTVETSSGSAALDAKTCEIVKERARFTPATDAAGRPVAGEFRQRITWQLEDPIMPAEDWSYEEVVTYHPDGKTISCKSGGTGAYEYPSAMTSECPHEPELSAELRGAGIARPGVLTIATISVRFARGQAKGRTLPSPPTGDLIAARQVVELSIAADGKVTNCRQISFESLGQPAPPPCEGYDRFLPPVASSDKSKPITATMVTTISLRAEERGEGVPTS
jgi:TonB family protein